MKKLFTLLALIATTAIFAQAPQGFNYQATVRNSSGALIVNQNVYFKFNVMLNSVSSVPVFSETHYTPTDDLGQVNLVIGQGTATTGSFSTINWGTGNYYLGIELNTGSGYVAMGTTQLLSVPYALYANSSGSSPSQGKTSIYLTGNITNAQAAAKIAAELGPYTENIYITNTNQLTTVDLSSLITISNIEIKYNSNLTLVNLNNLTSIDNKFDFYNNSQLSSISFPSLINCPEFDFNYNSSLTINIPLLSNINNFYLNSFNNSSITNLSFPSLQTISGNFYLNGPTSTTLTFPVLNTLSGNIFIQPNSIGGGNLTAISFPALTSCTNFYAKNSILTNPFFPAGGTIYIINNLAASINLSSLASCNEMYFDASSFNLSSLASCNAIAINSPSLTSLSFPSLTNNSNLSLGGNALTSNSVNSLLNKFLTVLPASGKNIYLSSQNPPAPPTGQGIIDKQTLINTGNNVTTD